MEDQIFKDAEKDKVAAKAYKLLVQVNDEYQNITDKISETGSVTNAALSLEDKIEKLQERTENLDVDTLKSDYNAVREENAEIISRIEKMMEKLNK